MKKLKDELKQYRIKIELWCLIISAYNNFMFADLKRFQNSIQFYT